MVAVMVMYVTSSWITSLVCSSGMVPCRQVYMLLYVVCYISNPFCSFQLPLSSHITAEARQPLYMG